MYLSYCRSLRFDETPDYSYLRRLFNRCASRTNFVTDDYLFDWTAKNKTLKKNKHESSGSASKMMAAAGGEKQRDDGGKRKSGGAEKVGGESLSGGDAEQKSATPARVSGHDDKMEIASAMKLVSMKGQDIRVGNGNGKGIRQRTNADDKKSGGVSSGAANGTRPPTSGALPPFLPPTVKHAPQDGDATLRSGGEQGAEILSSAGAHGAPSNGSNDLRYM
jgi:hypothetical protein